MHALLECIMHAHTCAYDAMLHYQPDRTPTEGAMIPERNLGHRGVHTKLSVPF